MVQQRINQKGQLIVEILVAFGLASILIPVIILGFISGSSGKAQQEQRLKATGLYKEAEEAVRSVRDSDWVSFANNGTFYPRVNGGIWGLSGDANYGQIGEFTRQVEISDVSPIDLSKKLVTITITWSNPLPTTLSSSFILTRWKNASFSETNTVSATGSGYGDWCQPAQSPTSVDLSRQGVPTSVLAAVSEDGTGNRVFAGTGGNASGPTFTNTKITGNPPSILAEALGDYNNTKANGIFGDSNYAFIATDKTSEEVTVLDLSQYSNPPTNTLYKKVGALDTPGPNDADSVYVLGNTGFVTTSAQNGSGSMLYVFDATDKTSLQMRGSVSLPGRGVKLIAVGNYVYIAISGSNTKMQIVDVSNPLSPTLSGGYVNSNLPDGRDVFVNSIGTRTYLVTAASANQPEFFILDTTNKSSPTLITGATYDTGGMDPYGVTIVPGLRGIVVGHGGHEYQVFVITDDVISPCPNVDNFLDIDEGVNAISSLTQPDGHAYSYIVTGDTGAELKIIEGGLGGGGGGGNGTFESGTLPVPDPGHDIAFNTFTATNDPNLTYKVSIKHGSAGSCSGVSYTGSDFNTFAPGPLPLTSIGGGYTNPGQCLRYRVVNASSSPATFTITFNYSP